MDGWTIVSSGPIWQVQLEAGRLAEEGIDAWVPDETIKVLDPFATGGLPLHTDLKVPVEHAKRARALLDQQIELAAEAADHEAAETSAEEDAHAGARETIEALARRTRWAALALITLPFAAWFGYRYIRVSCRTGIRDMKHGLTIAALWLGVAEALGFGATFVITDAHR